MSSFKDFRELRVRVKDFRFGDVWIWFDGKQPYFELVCVFNVFLT